MCDKDKDLLDINDFNIPDIPDDVESLEEATKGKPSPKSKDDNTYK